MLTDNTIRILIIDDDEDDYFIIADYIKELHQTKFIIDWCNEYTAAVKEFSRNNYNIYFVDYRLGNRTGLELLQEARAMGCNAPVILLTGKGSKSIDIEAMKSGATDYLIKSELTTEKLERCIRYSMDRTAALKAIRESETKYRNLFSGSKDALFISDKNLRFREVNQAACNLLASTPEDLQELELYDFIPDKFQKEEIRTRLEKNIVINDFEIEIANAGKEKRNCLISILIESNDGEEFVHGIVHDITNIKKAEKVKLQTEKLAANERLVRMLAHEVRNPLNNIKLSADHLLPGLETEKQKNLIGIIQRNSIRINQMITELLHSTKSAELSFERLALQDILEDSLSVASDRINLQKISLHKSFPESPLFINADKPKLQIAFSNILINAIEATELVDGKVSVSISEHPEGYSVLISDNGRGIPDEHLSKLFEPFFTSKKNGLGLGLSAAYGIVKAHKATMQVESIVNSGTTFKIDFERISTH